MRTILALLLTTSAASAFELPIQPGVTYCADAIEVDSTGVYGPDHQCLPAGDAAPDGSVPLACENAEESYGPSWQMNAVIIEDAAAKTLTYVDKDGALTMSKCLQ